MSLLLAIGMSGLMADLGPATAAFADHTGAPAGIVGGFEVDGNYSFDGYSMSTPSVTSTRDWTNAGAQSYADAANSATDSVFGGGNKEQEPNNWTFVSGPKPPGKDDLTRTYLATRVSGGVAHLFLGFERLDVSGSGDAHVDFEFNQSGTTITNGAGATIPARSNGDLLVVYEYSGGTGPVAITVYSWLGTPGKNAALFGSWQAMTLPAASLGSTASAVGDINGSSVSRPAFDGVPAATIGERRFGEAGLDLTTLFNANFPACRSFASFWTKSRASGESIDSQLKDRVTPVPIDVSTCPDVHVVKSASTASVNSDGSFSYTLTGTNDGPLAALGVHVTDTVPSGLTVNSATYRVGSGASTACSVSGNAVDCSVGTLAASDGATGGNDTVTVTINVSATASACPNVSNTAHISATNEVGNDLNDNDSAAVVVTVNCPNLSIAKVADAPSTVSAGGQIGFTITLTNSGPGAATNVSMTDTLAPADGTNGIAWSVAGTTGSPTCDIEDGVLTCTKASMAPGSFSVHVTSLTTSSSCGVYTNTASFTSGNAGTGSAHASVTVLCPEIGIRKVADKTEVNAGDAVGFTITVSNGADGVAAGVHVTDTLPANTGLDWTIDGGSMAEHCTIDGGALTCDLDTLNGGASAEVHISSATTRDTCGLVSNTAFVSTRNDGQGQSSASVQVDCPAIHIVKVASAPLAHVGDTITYTLTVTNTGDVPLVDVVVTDPICQSAPVYQSGDAGTDGILGFLESESEAWVYTCTHVVASTEDPVNNTATVVGHDVVGGPNGTVTDDDSATVDIIHPAIDITKDVNPVSGNPGDTVTYTYVVTNTGDTTLFDVSVDDDLLGHVGDIAVLDPGASATLTKSTTLSNTVGSVTNVGTAVGTDTLGKKVSDDDTATVAIVLAKVIRRPLPKTGEDLRHPIAAGLALVLVGTALMWVPVRKREEEIAG